MDIFVEQLVKRKARPTDLLKIFLCMAASFAVIFLLFIFGGMIVFVAAAALLYLIYNLGLSINVEYEYCLTNGALDIDKIIAARRRKRLTELNARDIEIMATVQNPEFKNYMKNRDIKKINASSSLKDDGVFFVIYSNDSKKYMLLFNPNDTIKDGFRRLNPQKVFLTD